MFVLVGECSFNTFFFVCTDLFATSREKNRMSLLLYYIGKLDCLFVKEIQILSCFMKDKKKSEMYIVFLSFQRSLHL